MNAAIWLLIQGIGRNLALADSICHMGLIPRGRRQLTQFPPRTGQRSQGNHTSWSYPT